MLKSDLNIVISDVTTAMKEPYLSDEATDALSRAEFFLKKYITERNRDIDERRTYVKYEDDELDK